MISRLLLALALAFTTAQQAGAQQTTWQPLGGRSGVPPYSFYTQPHAFLGQEAQPICQLTAGAVVNSDAQTCLNNPKAGIGIQSVTLTGASTLALPGHLPAKGGVNILYQITHSGTDGPTLANGFQYPAGVQPPECNGSTIVSGCWSTTAGFTDWLPCVSINATNIGCANVITGMAVTASKFFVQGKSGAYVAGPTTTGSVTLTSPAAAGQTILCMVAADGSVAPTSVNDGGSNTLTLLNSGLFGGSHFMGTYNKVGVVGTPQTITATWASATGHQLLCDVYAGVTATDGNNFNVQGSATGGTDAWVSGTITPTVTGDIIWGVIGDNCSLNATAGTGFQIRSVDPGSATFQLNSEDKTVSTTAAVQATFSGLTTGGCTAGSVATATAVIGLR